MELNSSSCLRRPEFCNVVGSKPQAGPRAQGRRVSFRDEPEREAEDVLEDGVEAENHPNQEIGPMMMPFFLHNQVSGDVMTLCLPPGSGFDDVALHFERLRGIPRQMLVQLPAGEDENSFFFAISALNVLITRENHEHETVCVHLGGCIHDVKNEIAKLLGILPTFQELTANGTVLNDSDVLTALMHDVDETIHLALREIPPTKGQSRRIMKTLKTAQAFIVLPGEGMFHCSECRTSYRQCEVPKHFTCCEQILRPGQLFQPARISLAAVPLALRILKESATTGHLVLQQRYRDFSVHMRCGAEPGALMFDWETLAKVHEVDSFLNHPSNIKLLKKARILQAFPRLIARDHRNFSERSPGLNLEWIEELAAWMGRMSCEPGCLRTFMACRIMLENLERMEHQLGSQVPHIRKAISGLGFSRLGRRAMRELRRELSHHDSPRAFTPLCQAIDADLLLFARCVYNIRRNGERGLTDVTPTNSLEVPVTTILRVFELLTNIELHRRWGDMMMP